MVTTISAAYSKEPISQCTPCGRVIPFCEVLFTGMAAQTVSSPLLMAGEPEIRGKYAGEPVNKPRLGSAVYRGVPHICPAGPLVSIRLFMLVAIVSPLPL